MIRTTTPTPVIVEEMLQFADDAAEIALARGDPIRATCPPSSMYIPLHLAR
ncbi:hypothetical protein [Methylobacterium planeticum]|uniref:hypothetical protein n=1 Tax=Methylobacterium planeticum TaxID=2615211 RepID=UPI001785BBCD|nr:hypothetical protein [Methylobacterium planeticum]